MQTPAELEKWLNKYPQWNPVNSALLFITSHKLAPNVRENISSWIVMHIEVKQTPIDQYLSQQDVNGKGLDPIDLLFAIADVLSRVDKYLLLERIGLQGILENYKNPENYSPQIFINPKEISYEEYIRRVSTLSEINSTGFYNKKQKEAISSTLLRHRKLFLQNNSNDENISIRYIDSQFKELKISLGINNISNEMRHIMDSKQEKRLERVSTPNFGKRFSHILQGENITEVTKKSNIPRTHIYNVINKHTLPDIKFLRKISKGLDKTYEHLLSQIIYLEDILHEKTIGGKLKYLRIIHNYTGVELLTVCLPTVTSLSSIFQYENNSRKISHDMLQKLSEVYNIPLELLIFLLGIKGK